MLDTGHLVTANSHQEFEPGREFFEVLGEERGEGVPIVGTVEVSLAKSIDEYHTFVLCDLATLLEDGERLENALKKGSMGV